jgi:CheY-like chemotaxis protein
VGKKRIMCVDDDELIQYSLKELFNKYTNIYDFVSVTSGEDCLDTLTLKTLPDLILLDIMMPKMSGWEVFNEIRENPEWRDIPIVFLTARTDKIAENAGEYLGDDYIEKPIDVEDFLERVDKILNSA